MQVINTVRTAACLIVSATLASCGGSPSDVGDRPGVAPTAIVTVIGHPYRVGTSGPTTTTVRAQSEVTLSAKDSAVGNSPILDFSFEQTDEHPRVALLSRSRNSVSFAAPAVTSDTTMTFKLKVTDANGASDEGEVNVLVKPILDPNRFLTYGPAPGTYTVVVVPAQTIPADNGAPIDAAAGEFTITVRRLLTYRDRVGTLRENVPLDVAPNAAPIQVQGKWLARTGASASCLNAPQNPRYILEIPSLDQEDLNVLVQTGDRNQQLEFADIDEASLQLQITIEQQTGSFAPRLCILNPDDASTAPLTEGLASTTIPISALRGSPSDALDTLASARAYYRTLGEETTKATFFEWLDANGFERTAPNFGADAHAVYTNNFDLGFGRDMYMKIGACDTPLLALGACDVASVVVNYPSLEAAAKKLSPIIAVAMEYKATPSSNGRRIVKFYAYAPDARSASGDYKRIHSVNLDGRGEKYLPEACTVCHGGTPGGLAAAGEYANGGDVNAAFLPWDLDTLLFSDTDPSFTSDPLDAQLRTALTRVEQESELRKLNAAAYLTYGDADRFALTRELIEGWYTPAALPIAQLDQVLSGAHFGAYVPEGWTANGVDGVAAGSDDNPADSAAIYTQVFGPFCRSCHTAQAPNPAVGDVRQSALCDADRPMTEATPGAGRQRPMGCYWQMASEPRLARRVSEGIMPLSRLTMDRFWIQADGAQRPAGETFAEHLEAVLGANGHINTPGTQAASLELQFNNPNGEVEEESSLDMGHYVQLAVRNAAFVRSYEWRVLQCADAADLSTCTTPIATSNASEAIASARIESPGAYQAELRVNGDDAAIATQLFTVANKTPQLAPASASTTFSLGASAPVSPLIEVLGNGTAAEHSVSVSVASAELEVEPATCIAPSSCDATTAIVLSSTSLVPLTSSFTLAVRDADDSTAVQATYPVSVTSTIAAGDRTICTRANLSGANLTSSLADCVAGVGFSASIDMLALNSASFGARSDLGVEFPSGTQMVLRNFNDNAGVLDVSSSGTPARERLVSYTPALRLSTHSRTGGTGLTSGGQPIFDTVPYRLVRFDEDGNVVEQSNTATLRIQINARTSFASDVMPVFSGQGCSSGGCHDGSAMNRPNYDQSAAQVFGIFRNADGSYRNMINTVAGQPRAYVIPAESTATVNSSGLLCWPMGTCGGHGGGMFTAGQLQAIRQWIEDGANGF